MPPYLFIVNRAPRLVNQAWLRELAVVDVMRRIWIQQYFQENQIKARGKKELHPTNSSLYRQMIKRAIAPSGRPTGPGTPAI
jgi:hypothetical protein